MANLWKAGHESGLWLPDWSVAPSGVEANNFAIETRPSGGSKDMGKKAIHYTKNSGGDWLVAPRATLPEPVPTEFYGSFQIRPEEMLDSGTLYTLGPECIVGLAAPYDGTAWNAKHFCIHIYKTPSTPANHANVTVRIGRDVSISGPGRQGVDASIAVPLGQWSQVDFYCRYGDDGEVRMKLDCGFESVGNGIASYSQSGLPQRFILTTPTAGWVEGWLDNFVINDTDGAINDNLPCLDPFPGTGFSGTKGKSIYPAPERLPHRVTAEEVGSIALAKKLNDNFDSIERQLLALDPDDTGADPMR